MNPLDFYPIGQGFVLTRHSRCMQGENRDRMSCFLERLGFFQHTRIISEVVPYNHAYSGHGSVSSRDRLRYFQRIHNGRNKIQGREKIVALMEAFESMNAGR